MSTNEAIDREEGQLLPYPLPGGENGIRWTRSRPATLEEITRALDRIEDPADWPQPSARELGRLVRDAFTILDTEPSQEAAELVERLYPLFRDSASFEQRLAEIDEAWSHGFEDGNWLFSLMYLVTLEREPALIAACAARYAAYVMMFAEIKWEEIAGMLERAELESETCRAATFLGLLALGESELMSEGLDELRREFSEDEVAIICGITLVEPNLATVLFMLEWMDEAQRHNDQARFAQLASAVERSGAAPECADLSPITSLNAGDLRLKVCYHEVVPITREQFGGRIRPRLEALAGRETGTRLIPPVLEAWGLRCRGEAS